MSTPWKLITHKSDTWHVKIKKWVARWLWNDLTKLPKPAEGYPDPDKLVVDGKYQRPIDWNLVEKIRRNWRGVS